MAYGIAESEADNAEQKETDAKTEHHPDAKG